MKILIIGGTRFVGRHLVNSARARGHEVTLFNRGRSNPDLFKQIKTIRGDREKDLDQLSGRWDAVIDTCGYVPRMVGISAEALKDKVEKYVFISTISVYADMSRPGTHENSILGKMEDETVEEITGETYGPLKVLCENVVQNTLGFKSLVIRPGLIVGPHDPTDRFTYWPVRIARGGDVLTPDRPSAPIQVIDARDLTDFIINALEQNLSGVFNVTGETLTLQTVFENSREISGSDANFKWAPVDFLIENKVEPWSDMPAWLPDTGETAGFAQVDISKALHAGLKLSSITDTIRDTLHWAADLPAEHEFKAGLKPEREKELLKKLNNVQ